MRVFGKGCASREAIHIGPKLHIMHVKNPTKSQYQQEMPSYTDPSANVECRYIASNVDPVRTPVQTSTVQTSIFLKSRTLRAMMETSKPSATDTERASRFNTK